jgi:hypothetical protein
MAVVMWPRPQRQVQPAPTNSIARVEPVAPSAAASSTPRVAPPEVATPRREARPPATATPVRAAAPSDPFLEVMTDQPELLRRLVISIEQPNVAVDATEPAGIYEAPKLEVPKVEVSPLSVFVVPNLRLPVGVSPIILRIAADAAEGSSK